VKLDANGTHVFSKRFGGIRNDEADAVAVDADDRVLVAGEVSATVDFGGGPISGGSFDDLFVLTLDPTGAHVCSRRYGTTLDGTSGALGLAVDAEGSALVAGALSGTVRFGGDPLTSTGGLDILLAKFRR
jgi:hypothetical protein